MNPDPFLGSRPKTAVTPTPLSLLTVAGNLGLEVNNPQALKSVGAGASEVAQGLPPYSRIQGYRVDDIPNAPPAWQRSGEQDGIPTMSYVVGVKPDSGLWFDFNRMGDSHSKHVAILVSMQGINAVTGRPIQGEIALEQYAGTRGDEPPQNYLASNVTPYPYLWLDGFRTADGTVRQFFVTKDTSRGIAAQKIGEARSFSIGFAIFESVALRPPQRRDVFRSAGAMQFGASKGLATRGGSFSAESLEIGAGAKINQRVFRDTEAPSFWQQRPSGLIVLHYVLEDDLAKLIQAVHTGGPTEGALAGVKVGN